MAISPCLPDMRFSSGVNCAEVFATCGALADMGKIEQARVQQAGAEGER